MAKHNPFTGYKNEIFDFLKELEENNNKDWFDVHRDFYEKEMRDTSKFLINDLSFAFASVGLPFVADTRKSMFRINRDIRFSKNKDPYKTNIGLFFPYSLDQMNKKPVLAPGLYFHIANDQCFIAGGLHTPPSDTLLSIRKRLSEDHKELERIIGEKHFLHEFPDGMYGESLKRIPRGFPKDHPAENYLRMKQFLVLCPIDKAKIHSTEIIDLIIQKSVAIAPFLNYFYEAIKGNN